MAATSIRRVLGRIAAVLVILVVAVGLTVLVAIHVFIANLGSDDVGQEREQMLYRVDELTGEFARLWEAGRPRSEYAAVVLANHGVIVSFRESDGLDVTVELTNSPYAGLEPGQLRQCYRFTVVPGEPPASTAEQATCTAASPTGGR